MERQKVMLTVGIVLVLLGVFAIVFLGREQVVGRAFAVEQDFVAKWDFEEASGTAVKDDNGRYTGLLLGTGVKRVNVREGTSDPRRALDFPGEARNGVEVKDANGEMPFGLRITNALTVSAWVKPARTPLTEMSIVDAGEWKLFGDATGSLVCDDGTNPATQTTFFSDAYINDWVHVVCTRDANGNLNLFTTSLADAIAPTVDVTAPTSASTTATPLVYDSPAPPLRIGFSVDATGNPTSAWEGGIDDVRIYERALSAVEIKVLFNESRTADCFNKYCSKPDEVFEIMPSFADSKYHADGTANSFNAVDVLPLDDGTTTNSDFTATGRDLYLLREPAFTDTTETNFPLTFAHNNKNYVLSLADQNQFEATAQLQVNSKATGQVLSTLELSATSEKPLELSLTQSALNLDTSTAEPEAYLQSFGYFDKDKKLGVLAGVTPFMNFDVATPWTVSFLSLQAQQLLFDKELHKVESSRVSATEFFLSVDGEEYLFTPTPTATTKRSYVHYFDRTQGKGVNITLLKIAGDIAIFSFNRIAAGLSNTYEEVMSKTDLVTVGGKVLRICAHDPAIVAAATICEGTTEVLDLLNGMAKEGTSAGTINTVNYGTALAGTLFYYEAPKEGEQKQVKVLHLVAFAANPSQEFALYFANNLVQKKHLALKMATDDYYLLEMQDKTKSFLELTNLKLTHLSDAAKSIYSPLGDQEKIKFNLPLQQQINLKLETTPRLKYVIEKTSSALPETVNIVNNLQASVSSYGAVSVKDITGATAPFTEQDSSLGVVSIDAGDVSTVEGKMKISFGATPTSQELDFNTPVVLTVNIDDPDNNEAQVLADYNKFTPGGTVERPQFTKYADLYLLYDLDVEDSPSITIPKGTLPRTHRFTDTEFILPLLKGNKLALKAGGANKFYLLSYAKPWSGAVSTGFSPEELRLTSFDGKAYSAQVSENGTEITFVLGNDVNVQMTIDTNAGTITFRKQTTATGLSAVAKPVNLMSDFKTTLTSSSPVNLQNSIGALVVSPVDTASFADRMIVEYVEAGTSARKLVELSDNIPQIVGEVTRAIADSHSNGNVLLLYNDFTSSQGIFTKSADVYLLYNLDEGEKTRPFTDDEFILPLVEKEQQLALRYKSSFYLLGYSGTISQGFRYNRLRLKPLLGGTTISPTTTENGVQFSVGGGNLLINFDTLNRKVTFGGALEVVPGQLPALRVFDPFAEYQTELPKYSSTPGADNTLRIGVTDMYNCDASEAIGFVEQVCVRGTLYPNANPAEHFLVKGKPYRFTYQYLDADGATRSGSVLLTYREKAGDYKRVTVQHLAGTLEKPTATSDSSFTVDWKRFSENVKNGRYSVVAPINAAGEVDDYLEIRGTDSLESLTLKSLMTGKEYKQTKVVTLGETGKELYVAVDEKAFKFSQAFDESTKTFALEVRWQSPLLVSAAGNELLLDAPQRFTPSLGAPAYALRGNLPAGTTAEKVAVLFIDDDRGNTLFQRSVSESSSVSALLPNGEVVVLQVVSVDERITLRIQK